MLAEALPGLFHAFELQDVGADAEYHERAATISEQGIIPPRFILDATEQQMRDFIGVPADRSPLVTTFVDRMSAVPAIPAERREALRREAQDIVEKDVYPAWRRGMTLLQGQAPKSTDAAGI